MGMEIQELKAQFKRVLGDPTEKKTKAEPFRLRRRSSSRELPVKKFPKNESRQQSQHIPIQSEAIHGWKQLSEEFLARFVSNTKIPKESDTLFGLRNEQEETLRNYARRYWEEYNDLEENVCSEQVAVMSFKHGLCSESTLRQSLTKRPTTALKDLRARIEQYACLEDDQIPIEVASAEQIARHKKRADRGEHRGIAVNEVDKSKSHEAVVTVFKEPIYRILEKIKREPFFVWSPKMLGDPARCN
ncbi:uncharacterized protein LOC114308760 [Camellia sinensis]|uniref:uncharacterized protein LOC114308760 n=1 Tax=Camellia sinensis TaxID=4442 RepID=UPI0010365B51|nr:uncharacterized protein LOC114308760 [Camellia sinensis]